MSASPRATGSDNPGLSPAVAQALRDDALFSLLTDAELDKLARVSERLVVPPESPILPPIDPDSLTRTGSTPVVYVLEGEAKVHATLDGVYQVLNQVRRREMFYNRTYDRKERETLELTSVSPLTALRIPAKHLDEILTNNESFKDAFLSHLKMAKERKKTYFRPEQQRVSSFIMDERLTPTNRVKFLRYDLCVECDICYDACATRHGVSRIWKSDVHLGVLSVPDNCHNCHYPTCEPACKFDVLRYDDREDELAVSRNCVGCQQCARNCTYGSITMVPFDLIDSAYLVGRSEDAKGGRRYAIKCDNCVGYRDLACVSSCPTGALFQVEGGALLDLLKDLDEKGTNKRVLNRLNPPPAFTAAFFKLTFWVVAFFATFEVLGRYYWPGFTIGELAYEIGLTDTGVRRDTAFPYHAGDSLSVTYGYIAAILALTGQLYRVRKALPFGGDMRKWLQMHIWLSLLGLVFAFWHLFFNFFGFPGIAWWSFLIACLSGMVGTYLHTWLPRGIAGKELALDKLQERLAKLTNDIEGYYRNRAEARGAAQAAKLRTNHTMMTRVQSLISTSAMGDNFLTGVFTLLMVDIASLQDRDEAQRKAARRAGATGQKRLELDKLISRRARLEAGIRNYNRIRNWTRRWRGVHRVASYVFIVALVLHVGYELIF